MDPGMPQLTIYLDAETIAKARAAAKSAGLSQSGWVADLIRRHASAQWPDTIRRLAGAWPDFPDASALRATLGKDVPREPLD